MTPEAKKRILVSDVQILCGFIAEMQIDDELVEQLDIDLKGLYLDLRELTRILASQ